MQENSLTIDHYIVSTPQDTRNTNLLKAIAVGIGVIGVALILATYAPSLIYSAKSGVTDTVSFYLGDTAKEIENVEFKPAVHSYVPRLDRSLPVEPRLNIPSIGVDTTIYEASAENYEDALRKGVWRVSDFGTPEKVDKPVILAAHRFGYLKWSNKYRRENSFYNLTKLTEGNLIEIYWKQRKYIYSVYKVEEGNEISDYSADIILYTCRDLTSDVRYFVYGRLLKI